MKTKCAPSETPDDIDLPALRARYRHERDKRLRPEGERQYVSAGDSAKDFIETDPYTPPADRALLSEDIDVAVLGGGFGGLIVGARVKQAGVKSLRIIESGGDFGGVWYWNRYPGVQCDLESYCYMPLLEELNYMPKHRYAFGSEIYEHCQRIARHFDLYEQALFSTTIRTLRWDESIKRWRVGTNRGDDIRARFIIMAAGSHSRAKLPGIPGLKDFKGHSFHTARWDYDYTGGDADGGLTKLADKRVALIGTGATGIQCAPFLAEHAKHLTIFQRTPSPVDVRNNVLTDQEWVKTLTPGWQLERQRMFHMGAFETISSPDEDLLCDGWAEVNRNLSAKLIAMGRPKLSPEALRALREEEDYKVMERLRRRVNTIVEDEKTAEALKPWYRFLCKRPCFNDEYLQAFNRPNVTLVDVSAARGVEQITEKGVVAGGTEYAVDCIIYASGFEITHDVKRRWTLEAIEGRGGRSLYDHWAEGLRTFHGMTSQNFPNQFFTGYSQAGQSANISATYDQQGKHIAYIISETLARGAVTVEPTQDAEEIWVKTIREKLVTNPQFWNECTPGYFNNEGATGMRAYNGEPYGPGFYAFEKLTQEWRDKGDMAGLVLGT